MNILNVKWINLALTSGEQGREDRQYGWQCIFGNLIQNRTILDVGAGLGNSRERLKLGGNVVTLQDPCSGLPVDFTTDIKHIPNKSYDIVTAFDVIEHVEDDIGFLTNLLRIAREAIVITTPNYNISRCKNKYHCREYTPSELLGLFDVKKICLLMSGKNMVHRLHTIDGFTSHDDPSQAIMVMV